MRLPCVTESDRQIAHWNSSLGGNNHYYELITDPLTWTEAKDAAAARTYKGIAGHLVTITSPEENKFLTSLGDLDGFAWIGGSDKAEEGDWQWVVGPEEGTQFWSGGPDGTQTTYANWGPVEPNNDVNEPFAGINLGTTSTFGTQNGQWGDTKNSASNVYGYIVEYSDVPSNVSANVTVRVEDGRGGSDEQGFTIQIGPADSGSLGDIQGQVKKVKTVSVDLEVPGTADPWLAGLPDGTKASGRDVAPDHSPILVNSLPLDDASFLTFEASGGTSNIPSVPRDQTPDGDVNYIVGHFAQAENGIGNILAPLSGLMGVFLDTQQPNFSSAPTEVLDFRDSGNVNGGVNYLELSPELKQPFFIGDGLTVAGDRQKINVPLESGKNCLN